MTRKVTTMGSTSRRAAVALVALLGLTFGACRQDMHDQPKYEVYEASAFFEDGSAARVPPENTVARGFVREADAYHTGYDEATDELVGEIPMALSLEVLEEGRRRYDGFCAPCHDRVGTGRGMVVRRGYKQPPSFHIDRLVEAPAGHFFDAMTIGFGQMPSYAGQVKVEDRWAIVAYIRALQLAQRAPLAELSPEDRRRVQTIDIPGQDGAEGEHGAGAHGESAAADHSEAAE